MSSVEEQEPVREQSAEEDEGDSEQFEEVDEEPVKAKYEEPVKIRGQKGGFTDDQRRYIRGKPMKAWYKFYEDYSDNKPKLNIWKKGKAEEIYESPLFKDKLDGKRTQSEWIKVSVRSVIKNQGIIHITKSITRMFKPPRTEAKPSGGGNTKTNTTDVHDPVKCFDSLRLGSRCWAHFTSEVDDGRELFRKENYNLIREEAIRTDAKSRGGAFSKALARLWNNLGAEQESYNARARREIDIHQ